MSVKRLDDVDPCLLWLLHRAGETWGPLGVALAAARLTDPEVVVARLHEPASLTTEETAGSGDGWKGDHMTMSGWFFILSDWDTCPSCGHWGHRHREQTADGMADGDCDLCEERAEFGGEPCRYVWQTKLSRNPGRIAGEHGGAYHA